jgi:outer membrane protein TolC
LFPKFTLTGNIGYESIGADDFLSSASRVWSIGPGISWPIFSAGRIRAQINAEEAGAEAAALEYEKTVLLALEDAESAFTQYGRELETRNQLKQAVATRNNNLELSRKRYESGLDSLINLIDTEREALTSQEELVASETQTLVKLVRLYKSLGGGWESFEH